MELQGTCQSCGAVGTVFHVPHHQPNNPVMHEYCERCEFAYEKEVAVNDELRQLSATFDPANPNAANPNDPRVVAELHAKHHVELLEKKRAEQAAQPEQTIEASEAMPAAQPSEYVIPQPVIQEAEVVEVQAEPVFVSEQQ